MRVSFNWLKEYVDIPIGPDELAERMTQLGLEIESIERPGAEITEVYIGKILSVEPHPDADKIVVCQTDVGHGEPRQICCGATNMKAGDLVPTAVEGAVLPGGFKIGRRKMRGVESQGMMCSAKELGLGEEHDGLLILDPNLTVGDDAKSALGLDDVIFEIEVTPNRGDWASMVGVARELAALFDTTHHVPDPFVNESREDARKLTSVTLDDESRCPKYMGRVLTGVKVGPSPQWLCERLQAAGQRPINNVVDITNYVLLETGQPLHAFDLDRLAENRIVVRTAKAGEKIDTLDGETRSLTEEMLVIADAEKPQCIAGVMGGADSEVGEGTSRIFLESAYFDPIAVRRTSRALGLVSESSQRFQRGADWDMTLPALDRACVLLQELAGAEVADGLLAEGEWSPEPREVTVRYARTNQLLGTTIAPDIQEKILRRLGLAPIKSDDTSVTVFVPPRRHDVGCEADLIEEILRLHGFEHIEAVLPRVRPTSNVIAPEEVRVRELRHALVQQGLSEFYSWSFSNDEDVAKAGLSATHGEMIRLENPLSEKQATMRSTLLPGLLNAAAYNLNRGTRDIAAFEIGPVYTPAADSPQGNQALNAGIVLSGARHATHWNTPEAGVDFYDIKGYAERILGRYGVKANFETGEWELFQSGQSAAIQIDKQVIGHFGKLAFTPQKNFDIGQDLYLLELCLDPLAGRSVDYVQFSPVPGFPPSTRDLAVLVDAHLPAGVLTETAQRAGGKLLQKAEVFDIFTGEQVPEGKKSVALNLVFQSPDRTLTDKDTDKSFNKILHQLKQHHGAEIR